MRKPLAQSHNPGIGVNDPKAGLGRARNQQAAIICPQINGGKYMAPASAPPIAAKRWRDGCSTRVNLWRLAGTDLIAQSFSLLDAL
jgi:hypothetical protein